MFSRAEGQQPEMLGRRRWNDVSVVERGGRCQKIVDLGDRSAAIVSGPRYTTGIIVELCMGMGILSREWEWRIFLYVKNSH